MRHPSRIGMVISAFLCVALSLPLVISCSEKKPYPDNDNSNIGSLDDETEQSPTYHFLAGEVSIDRGQYHEALTHYLWLANHMDDPVFAARATSVALELKNYEVAAQTGKIWADKMPHDLQTQAIAASLLLKTGCIDCAKPYLSSLLLPSDIETMQHLAQVHATLDDATSQQHLVTALDQLGHEKKDPRALFIEADIQYQLGHPDAANKTIDAILALKPNWLRAESLRIQILYETGHQKEAFNLLNNLIAKAPNNAALKWLAAKMSIEMGDRDKGLAILKSIQHDQAYGNDATLELVKQYVTIGKFSEAKTYLNEFQEKNPNSGEGHFLMGFIEQESGNLEKALQSYAQVNDPNFYMNARIQMALIENKQGNVSAALAETDRLSEQFPDELNKIQLVRAQILLDSNQFNAAYDTLNNIIINGHEGNVELRYVRGLIAIELHRDKSAMSDFKYVISKNPKHLGAINALTQLLINEGALEDAAQYSEQAMNISPTNPDVLDNAGFLKLKRGNPNEAIPYLVRAYRTSQNPEYAAHLGEALWQNGAQTEAINVWNQGLEKDPSNAQLLDLLKTHLVKPASIK